MHELSVAQSILDTLLRERAERNLPGIEAVGVKVGALSGVLPDALQFSFEALRLDTPLSSCRMEMDEIAVTVRCEDCARVSSVENLLFLCPLCGSVRIEVLTGYELEISYLEVPDVEDAGPPDLPESNASPSSVQPMDAPP